MKIIFLYIVMYFSVINSVSAAESKNVFCDFGDNANDVTVNLTFGEKLVTGAIKINRDYESVNSEYTVARDGEYTSYLWSHDVIDHGTNKVIGKSDKISQFRGPYYYEGGTTVFFDNPDVKHEGRIKIQPCRLQ
ncbi:hypothetical protein HUO09_08550 [Vibrio sp. Y2-5]|uniref:hypothetical protein n=1 Tax=Vibrio sp. Y2-5 TaxID=2743977 RepID=UPI0016617EEE|nr:hypothetical protein [Vibrio sp. Y2-5]MBD0786395.1 hypothetical protein [Vibrio sp. Y2-5]